MKNFPSKLLLSAICLFAFLANAAAQHPFGVNLASCRDWSSELVFKDAFKMCREWTQVNLLDGSSAPAFEIALRPDGYPVALPLASGGNNYGVRTFLFTDADFPIPPGNYTLISEGTGAIRIRQSGGASQTFGSPGTHTVAQTTGTFFIIDIIQSAESDPVRNIRFVLPGFVDSYQTEPFHPEFLSFLQPFSCIRFMDWMRTNASTVTSWAHRTPEDYYSQTLPFFGNAPYTGVAYEHLVALCNTLGKDAWVNIPHQADDAYIQQFALFLRDRLDPGLNIYVEYSNELWNTAPAFPQSIWAGEQGQALGYPGPVANQRRLFTARRSADIFRIFETAFGDEQDRLVKVLAGQAGNTAVAQTILNAFLTNAENVNPDGVGVDALAIAPYFGNFVTSATSVDDALDQAEMSLDLAFQRILAHRDLLADEGWDLPLIAYEGGQHLDGPNAATDDLFCAANQHDRMGELYCEYLNFWYDNGGGLFMHYNSVSPCSASGSWGLKAYTGQPDEQAPKFTAALTCALATGADEPAGRLPGLFRVCPNPAGEFLQIQICDHEKWEISLFDLRGRLQYRQLVSGSQTIGLEGWPAGLYLWRAVSGGRIFSGQFVKQ